MKMEETDEKLPKQIMAKINESGTVELQPLQRLAVLYDFIDFDAGRRFYTCSEWV
jgi:hypothetical protein